MFHSIQDMLHFRYDYPILIRKWAIILFHYYNCRYPLNGQIKLYEGYGLFLVDRLTDFSHEKEGPCGVFLDYVEEWSISPEDGG